MLIPREITVIGLVRMAATYLFVLAFVGIFIDRIMRGDFDKFSLIFVFTAMFCFLISEWAKDKETKKRPHRRRASETMWEEFRRDIR